MELTKKPLGSAAVILDQVGRVLLVKHTYGKLNWDLPGGAAEPNESVAGTAIREVREETGLHVVVDRMVGCVYYDQRFDMHHFVFVCRPVDHQAVPHASSPEISDWGYWPVDALPRPISDFTIQRIRDAVGTESQPRVVEVGPRVWVE